MDNYDKRLLIFFAVGVVIVTAYFAMGMGWVWARFGRGSMLLLPWVLCWATLVWIMWHTTPRIAARRVLAVRVVLIAPFIAIAVMFVAFMLTYALAGTLGPLLRKSRSLNVLSHLTDLEHTAVLVGRREP
jgi:hypothetical protein